MPSVFVHTPHHQRGRHHHQEQLSAFLFPSNTPFLLPTMTSAATASTVLPTLLQSTFPSLDQPVLDYFTAILLDLLPSIHSAAALSTHFADLLIHQEVVDTPQDADSTCHSLFASLLRSSLVKAKALKSSPSPHSTSSPSSAPSPSKPSPSFPEEKAADPSSSEEPLYDPFVTVAVAQTTRKAKRALPTPATSAPRPTLSSPSDDAPPPLSSSSSPPPDVDIGYACDALYPSDQQYYAAIITAISPTADKLQVLYLEYGNYEWLTRDSVRNIRDAAADADDEEEEDRGKSSEVRLLTKAVRIGDAEEQEKEKRDKRRAERKAEEERRELERGGTGLKLSRKKLMERERKRAEDAMKRLWDETKRREEMAAAVPIHLKAVESMRRDRSKKWERDVQITELTLLAPDNAVLLHNTEFKLVAGRRYGLIGRNGIGQLILSRTRTPFFATLLRLTFLSLRCCSVIRQNDVAATPERLQDRRLPRLPQSAACGAGPIY